MSAPRHRPVRLMVVTSAHPAGRSLADLALAAVRAGADVVQVRDHDLTDRALADVVRTAVAAVRPHGGRVLVNDRLDVAVAAGADGVHLKAGGLVPAEVRVVAEAAGRMSFLVGMAAHGVEDLVAALADPTVDHVTIGPLNASPGKSPLGLAGLARFLDAARARVPSPWRAAWLVLGGVEPKDVPDLAVLARPGERWGVAAIRPFIGAAGGGPDQAAEAARAFATALASPGRDDGRR